MSLKVNQLKYFFLIIKTVDNSEVYGENIIKIKKKVCRKRLKMEKNLKLKNPLFFYFSYKNRFAELLLTHLGETYHFKDF